MKSFLSKCLVIVCVLAMSGLAIGVQEKKDKKKAAPEPTAALMAKVAKLDLTAEQKTKLEALAAEHGPKLKEALAAVNKILTKEQVAAKAQAMKAAKDAGKKGKEAADAVSEALKLTDDQKKTMADADKVLKDAQAGWNKAVAELLTAEQKEKAGLGGKKKKA